MNSMGGLSLAFEHDQLSRVFENLDQIDDILQSILEEKNRIIQMALGDDTGISKEHQIQLDAIDNPMGFVDNQVDQKVPMDSKIENKQRETMDELLQLGNFSKTESETNKQIIADQQIYENTKIVLTEGAKVLKNDQEILEKKPVESAGVESANKKKCKKFLDDGQISSDELPQRKKTQP